MRLNLAVIGPEAAFARGRAPPSEAGPTAGSGGVVAWTSAAPDHPLHLPCREVPGPASLSGLLLEQRAGSVGTTLPLPTRSPYPTPVPPAVAIAVDVGSALTAVSGTL